MTTSDNSDLCDGDVAAVKLVIPDAVSSRRCVSTDGAADDDELQSSICRRDKQPVINHVL